MSNSNIALQSFQIFNVVESGTRMIDSGPQQYLLIEVKGSNFHTKKQAEDWIEEKGRIGESYTVLKIFKKD